MLVFIHTWKNPIRIQTKAEEPEKNHVASKKNHLSTKQYQKKVWHRNKTFIFGVFWKWNTHTWKKPFRVMKKPKASKPWKAWNLENLENIESPSILNIHLPSGPVPQGSVVMNFQYNPSFWDSFQYIPSKFQFTLEKKTFRTKNNRILHFGTVSNTFLPNFNSHLKKTISVQKQ